MLERGFWLYVWRIKNEARTFYYVGRTGDSSSRFAASPFSRLSQHLDVRPTANGNTLLRHVLKMNVNPFMCQYDMIALGPIFPEQESLERHREHRDRIAPLEAGLARHLRTRGMHVVGSHGIDAGAEEELLSQIKSACDEAMAQCFR
jgi:hypothetical protein